jgi:hypothetical protein
LSYFLSFRKTSLKFPQNLSDRQTCKLRRSAVLAEWQSLMA